MYNFDFEKPSTIADAVSAMGADENTSAGGVDIDPYAKAAFSQPSKLVSLSGIAEMKGVCEADGGISVGGATTHATVAAEAVAYPALAALASNIGDPAVRNRGQSADHWPDPAACYHLQPWHQARLETNSWCCDGYFQNMFTTALEEERSSQTFASQFQKRPAIKNLNNQRHVLRWLVFVAKYSNGVRVAVTGASEDGVFRWTEAEEALSGNFSADAVEGLSVSAMALIADLHSSGDYRAHLVKVLLKRAVAAAS